MSSMGEGWFFHSFGGGDEQPSAAEPQAQQPQQSGPIKGGQPGDPWLKTAGPNPAARIGATFSMSGAGKYYNPRNVSGEQFNKPAIMGAVKKGVQAYSEAQYFRHAGFGAALRHTLGMPQMPSHMNDYLRARHNNKNVGIDPHSITGQFSTQDPQEYEHW